MKLETDERILFIYDIEGEEIEFLKAGAIERFSSSIFLIEIHYMEYLEEFKNRLSSHFSLEFIPVKRRSMHYFPLSLNFFQKQIFSRYWVSLIQEWRTSNSYGWLIIKPKEIS
jgi:hypothetical protein